MVFLEVIIAKMEQTKEYYVKGKVGVKWLVGEMNVIRVVKIKLLQAKWYIGKTDKGAERNKKQRKDRPKRLKIGRWKTDEGMKHKRETEIKEGIKK